MALSDITSREAVLAAIRECMQMGRDRFLAHYGFRHARSFYLIHEGQEYDSKAIAGVAHRFQFPSKGPLRAAEFSGGKAAVKPKLESLGFTVKIR
jgi:hypothetical protein